MSILSFKEIKEKLQLNEAITSSADLPVMLVLKRKYIRMFPDGQVVALYYSNQLDRYISVPYSSINVSESKSRNDEIEAIIDSVLNDYANKKITYKKAIDILKKAKIANPESLLKRSK